MLVLVQILILFALLNVCESTHFAFGTVQWRRNDPKANDARIIFRTEQAWRYDFRPWTNQVGRLPQVDDTINVGTFVWKTSGQNDETYAIDPFKITIIVPDSSQNWLQGVYEWDTEELLPSMGPWVLKFMSCCRVRLLQDQNSETDYIMRAQFNFDGREFGIKTTQIAARQFFEVNKKARYTVQAVLSNSMKPKFDFCPTGSNDNNMGSGLARAVPGETTNNRLILDEDTGKFTWTPTITGIYAICIKIYEDCDALNFPGKAPPPNGCGGGEETDFIPLDFIIEVGEDCATTGLNCAPYFVPEAPEELNPRCTDIDQTNLDKCAMSPQRFFRNIEGSFTVVAEDGDVGDSVRIEASGLVDGAACTLKNTYNTLVNGDPGPRVEYECSWTPGLSSSDFPVCYLAVDNEGKSNSNQYCIEWKIVNAPILYVSGIIRDFAPDHPDFSHGNGPKDTNIGALVEDTLVDGKPILKGSPSSIQSAATFKQWWTDNATVNERMVLSRTLSEIDEQRPGIYTYSTNNFHPINNLLKGNDVNNENNYFTWEVHTYITVDPSFILRIKSADDFWLFINNKLALHIDGIQGGTAVEKSLTLGNIMSSHNLKDGKTFRCDFFYACRSTTPALQLELPKGTLCNALADDKGSKEIDLPLTTDVPLTRRGTVAPTIDGTGLTLLRPEAVSGSIGAVWFAKDTGGLTSSVKIKVLKGFEATFNFTARTGLDNGYPSDNKCEGFAFVMQNDRGDVDGNPGNQLGYGGIKNSVAIEFDMNPDENTNGYQHVAVHSPLIANVPNSATDYLQAKSQWPLADPQIAPPELTMTNGTMHAVRITYTPSRDSDPNTDGWLRVYMGVHILGEWVWVLAPFVEMGVLNTQMSKLFPDDSAYVGFTSSSGTGTSRCSIKIVDWETRVVTLDPEQTTIGKSNKTPNRIKAGVDPQLMITTRDACGLPLLVGEDADFFDVEVRKFHGKRLILDSTTPDGLGQKKTIVTSNHDGTYSVNFATSIATEIEVHISYDSVVLQNSPFLLTIHPESTSKEKSTWVIPMGQLEVKRHNAPQDAASRGLYYVRFDTTTGKEIEMDVWNNQSPGPDPATSGIIAAVMYNNNQERAIHRDWLSMSEDLPSYNKGQSWCFISVDGTKVAESLVVDDSCSVTHKINGFVVEASASGYVTGSQSGYINAIQAVDQQNQERYRFPASDSDEASFTIIARDMFGNLASGSYDFFSYQFTVDVNNQSLPDGNHDVGYYLCKWSSTLAGNNDLYVQLNDLDIKDSPGQIVILARHPDKDESKATGSGFTQALAGQDAVIELALFDKFKNRLSLAPADGIVDGYLKDTNDNTFPFTSKMWNSDNQGGEYFEFTYNLEKIGQYILVINIVDTNGDVNEMAYTKDHTITVLPGPAYAPNCHIVSIQNTITAGTTYLFEIQSQDQFENNLMFELSGNQRYTVTGPTYVETPVYIGDGIYRVRYYHEITEDFRLQIKLGTTNIHANTQPPNGYLITCTAGDPSSRSQLRSQTYVVQAGQNHLFDILSVDKFGNDRPGNGGEDAAVFFLVSIQSPGNVILYTSLEWDTSNIYRVTWSSETADTHTIKVVATTVSSGDGEVINSPMSVIVTPGPTDRGKSQPPWGTGTRGGIEGTEVSFTIQAKDQYGNNQLDNVEDEFTAELEFDAQTTLLDVNKVQQDGNSGLWTVSYTIPPVETYIIKYKLSGVDVWSANLVTVANNSIAVIKIDTSCRTSFEFTANTIPQTLPRFSHLTKICGPKPYDDIPGRFTADIMATDTEVISTGTVSNVDEPNSNEYELSFIQSRAANYTITMFWSGIGVQILDDFACATPDRCETANRQVNLQIVPDVIFNPRCTFAPSGGTTIIAGQPAKITAILRDQYSNVITDTDNVVTVIGSPSNIIDQSSKFDAATEMWTITFSIQKESNYNIDVYVNGLKSSSISTRFTIIPDSPDAAKSTVQDINPSTVAGQESQFEITLRDQFNNLITKYSNLANLKIVPSAQMGDDTFERSEKSGGNYAIRFNPTKSGNFHLDVSLANDENIGRAIMNVSSASFSSTLSTVEMPGSDTTAGTQLGFSLDARDIYNNPWSFNSGDASRIAVEARNNRGYSYQATIQDNFGPDSTWDISLSGDDTKIASNYIWSLRIDGVKQTMEIPASSVVAAEVDATVSETPPSLEDIMVLEERNVSLNLKDKFGNDANAKSFVPSKAEIVFYSSIPCSNNDDDDEGGNSTLEISTGIQMEGDFKISDNVLTFHYSSTVAGTFYIGFSYGSTNFTCPQLLAMKQYVSSGRAVAAKSYFTTSIEADYTSGTPLTARVVLKDKAGNLIDHIFDYDKKIKVRGTYFDDSTVIVTPTKKRFEFLVTFIPACSGDHEVKLSLEDIDITGGQNGGVDNLTVIPGPIFAFHVPAFKNMEVEQNQNSFFCLQDTVVLKSFVAALQNSFNLIGIDEYGNALSVIENTHSYNIKFSLREPNNGYTFSPKIKSLGNGMHTVSFLSAWDGRFLVEVALENPNYGPILYNIEVNPSACPDQHVRCPVTNICKSDHNQCTQSFTVCTDEKNLCFDGSCLPECPCPGNMDRCMSGHCATSCHSSKQCSANMKQCPTGECREELDQCPSPRVCPLGAFMCPETLTCVVNEAECPDPNNSTDHECQRCWDGSCANLFDDCPTRKTCRPEEGQFLCPDGTCTNDSNMCKQLIPCDPLPVRCPDGSCRNDFQNCPSNVVCFDGYVLCPNNKCAPTLKECMTSPICTEIEGTWICPDGSCARNPMLCPSKITCSKDAPVLCSDGNCVLSIRDCPAPSTAATCSEESQICPDGSCKSGNPPPPCPTPKICLQGYELKDLSDSRPVLCPDGHCYASRSDCQSIPKCQGGTPIRCPDSSCAQNLMECPTQVSCPPNFPVHCLNGQCAAASHLCVNPDLMTCEGRITCPGGECADSRALCPTHLTCPSTTSRCVDGSCRKSCEIPNKNKDENISPCEPGTIECPAASIGVSCAISLSGCPSDPVCPSDRPVRCLESTCEAKVEFCNVPDDEDYDETRIACPDGTWSRNLQSCSSPTVCSEDSPFKCFDGTCRPSPDDCPSPKDCPVDTPYLCPTGECLEKLSDPDCTPQCSSGMECKCPPERPIRCSGAKECVLSQSECVEHLDGCTDGQYRCRNGFCAESPQACDALQCPTSLPYLCPDGLCTWNASRCNDLETGCPWDQTYEENGQKLHGRCWDGKCRDNDRSAENCYNAPIGIIECGEGKTFCPDASICAEQGKCPTLMNGCLPNEMRCADKSCVPKPGEPDTYSDCVKGYSQANACPSEAPFRCVSGYCATSESRCPQIPNYCENNDKRGVPCADGSCTYTADQCPVLRPCKDPTPYRCLGDGKCVIDKKSCFAGDLCPENYRRCSTSGLCVMSLDDCVDEATGCPMFSKKCPNGACYPVSEFNVTKELEQCENDESSCKNAINSAKAVCDQAQQDCTNAANDTSGRAICVTVWQNCLTGIDSESTCSNKYAACIAQDPCSNIQVPISGCTDIQCWNGDCKKTQIECPYRSGCPRDEGPIRCPDGSCVENNCPSDTGCEDPKILCGDGNCQDKASGCNTTNGCPNNAPIRCADGTCKKYPMIAWKSFPNDVCDVVVGCQDGEYLCYNGLCVASKAFCQPSKIVLCQSPRHLCANGDCVQTKSDCDISCPKNSPVMCKDGACTNKIQDCPSPPVCLNKAEIACFDGSCRSPLDCLFLRAQVENSDSSSDKNVLEIDDKACDGGSSSLCSDGSCVPDTRLCPIVPKCPPDSIRVWDGSCKTDGESSSVPNCPTKGYLRCEDGACRQKCLDYDGCPLQEPFHCPNSECAQNKNSCEEMIAPPKKHPCYTNCKRNVKASLFQYTVDPSKEVKIDVAIDSSNKAIGSLTVPSGAFLSKTGTLPTISILPVADSLLRKAHNDLPRSRWEDFDGKREFSYHETLLSVAVECRTNAQQDKSNFLVDLTFDAEIDITMVDEKVDAQDICLAYLFRIPELNYYRWKCVYDPATRLKYPVRSEDTDTPELVSGVIANCGKSTEEEESEEQTSSSRRLAQTNENDLVHVGKIYAFIHAPVPKPRVEPIEPESWWAKNGIIFMSIFISLGLLVMIVFWAIKRQYRYRGKLKREQTARRKLDEEVADAEQFGTVQSDGGLQMTSNPLSAQVMQLKTEINDSNEEIKKEELRLKEEQSQEREDHINNLKEDRDALDDRLRKLQKQFEDEQKLQHARKPVRRTQDSIEDPEADSLIKRNDPIKKSGKSPQRNVRDFASKRPAKRNIQ